MDEYAISTLSLITALITRLQSQGVISEQEVNEIYKLATQIEAEAKGEKAERKINPADLVDFA